MDRKTKSVRRVKRKEERKEREEIRSLPLVCRPPIPLSRSTFLVRAVRDGGKGTCHPSLPPSLPPSVPASVWSARSTFFPLRPVCAGREDKGGNDAHVPTLAQPNTTDNKTLHPCLLAVPPSLILSARSAVAAVTKADGRNG